MPTSKFITADSSFSLTSTLRRAMTMRSADPAKLARPAHDFIIDARTGAGHASGTLPAENAAIGSGGLVNLGRNSHTALPAGIRGAVTAKAGTNATVVNYATDGSGRGGIKDPVPAFNRGALVQKVAIADNLVGHPPSEGWHDFLCIAWIRPSAVNGAAFGYGTPAERFWGGYIVNSAGSPRFHDALTGGIIATGTADQWTQMALHYAFNAGTGTIAVRAFRNGAEVTITGGTAVTCATLTARAFATGKQMALGNNFDPSLTGLLARLERIFTGQANYTLDPLEEVQRNWTALRGEFGL